MKVFNYFAFLAPSRDENIFVFLKLHCNLKEGNLARKKIYLAKAQSSQRKYNYSNNYINTRQYHLTGQLYFALIAIFCVLVFAALSEILNSCAIRQPLNQTICSSNSIIGIASFSC